jgi:CBS domain containing-hemolysin-like protein
MAIIPLLILGLLLLQGFFSGSEIALVNADRLKLRHLAGRGRRGARLVLKMFQRPEVLLGTTLVGTNIALVSLTTLSTLLAVRLFGEYGDLVVLLVCAPLFLVLGEVVPKSVYQQKADTLAPIIVYPLRLFCLLFYPIVFLFSSVARLMARLLGVPSAHRGLFKTREQVRMMLEGAEQAANVDVFDRDRMVRTVRFASTTVGEVMIPIGEVIMLSYRESVEEAIATARKHGYFRLPVYQDEPGHVVGVAAFAFWELMDPTLRERELAELTRPVLFVVKSQLVDEIVGPLQARDERMAIVVDEFGSAIGMITLEDVLEQVVGSVAKLAYSLGENPERRRPRIERIGHSSYRVDGRALLSDLSEEIDVPIDGGAVLTVGGLLISRLHHLPQPGEWVVAAGYRFTVEEISDRGVRRVMVEPA